MLSDFIQCFPIRNLQLLNHYAFIVSMKNPSNLNYHILFSLSSSLLNQNPVIADITFGIYYAFCSDWLITDAIKTPFDFTTYFSYVCHLLSVILLLFWWFQGSTDEDKISSLRMWYILTVKSIKAITAQTLLFFQSARRVWYRKQWQQYKINCPLSMSIIFWGSLVRI